MGIEGAANVGLYGRSYADHDQRSVLCTATAGLVSLICTTDLFKLTDVPSFRDETE